MINITQSAPGQLYSTPCATTVDSPVLSSDVPPISSESKRRVRRPRLEYQIAADALFRTSSGWDQLPYLRPVPCKICRKRKQKCTFQPEIQVCDYCSTERLECSGHAYTKFRLERMTIAAEGQYSQLRQTQRSTHNNHLSQSSHTMDPGMSSDLDSERISLSQRLVHHPGTAMSQRPVAYPTAMISQEISIPGHINPGSMPLQHPTSWALDLPYAGEIYNDSCNIFDIEPFAPWQMQ